MKIKTQFFITMLLFGLTLSIIAASVLVSSSQIARIDQQEDIAVNVGRDATQLGYLAGDYVMHREAQQQLRWQKKWSSISDEVSRLDPRSAEERAIVRSINSDLLRLRQVFEDVAGKIGNPSQAQVSVSWSRVAVQNEALAFDSARLMQVLRSRKNYVQHRNALLIVTLVGLFGVYFAANYLIVNGRALRSVAQMQAGIEIIGLGNLDHTIPVSRDDEIGDLSRAFNKMTMDLKGVTASKSQLEEEIAEREAAEESLRDSIRQIAELSESRQQELSTTKKLLEAAHVVAQWTDAEKVAKGLAEILLKLTSHSRATVDSWDAERREIKVMASEGKLPYAVGSRWPIDKVSAAAKRAISEQDGGTWDIDELPEADRGIAASDYRLGHSLYVPLVQRHETVGMIVLDDPDTRREFSEREIQLVKGIAAQAGVAFENARLFKTQRQIADRLQEALLVLPDTLPGVEFAHAYHSATMATRVGGDFYDLFELSTDHIGVVIGDVAGKGLNAAVLTSMVKNTIRAHANEEGKTPRRILELTNDVIYRATSSESFVTVFFGILDRRNGRLVYSSAGHTSATVTRADGTIATLPATGPLLGAFASAVFEEAEARIEVDEPLLLYTDGLTEARRDGELYGESRLLEVLASTTNRSADALVGHVVADVMAYSGNRLRDDLAVLALRLTEHEAGSPMQQKLDLA